MRNLPVVGLLIFSWNTCVQQSGPKALSSQEPGAQVRQKFFSSYNSQDVDAVAAL
jgi:hypothetical protein